MLIIDVIIDVIIDEIDVIIDVIISTWQESLVVIGTFSKLRVATFRTVFTHDCESQKSPSPQK